MCGNYALDAVVFFCPGAPELRLSLDFCLLPLAYLPHEVRGINFGEIHFKLLLPAMRDAEVRLPAGLDEVADVPLGRPPVRPLLLLADRGLAPIVGLDGEGKKPVLEEAGPVRLPQPTPFPEHLPEVSVLVGLERGEVPKVFRIAVLLCEGPRDRVKGVERGLLACPVQCRAVV